MLALVVPVVAAATLCEQAGARYSACVAEATGLVVPPDAGALAACEADTQSQALWRTCLPSPTCAAFLGCVDDAVERAVEAETRRRGAATADLDRAAQCEDHVQHALRSVALQIVVSGRGGEQAVEGRDCLLAERPIAECLDEAEQAKLEGYARQRREDCAAWPQELAACVLGLPGAVGCKPDEYPLWVEPVDRGGAGPPIVWTMSMATGSESRVELADDGVLLVKEAYTGLRAVRNGETLWRDDTRWYDFAVGDGVVLQTAGDRGLEVVEAATGRRIRTLEDAAIWGLAPDLVLDADGRIFRIDAAACFAAPPAPPERKRRAGRRPAPPTPTPTADPSHPPAGPGCATQVATVPEEALANDALVAEIGGLWVAGSGAAVFGYDREGGRRFALDLGSLSADWLVPVPPDRLAVGKSYGVVLVEVGACTGELELKDAPCVVDRGGSRAGDWQRPVPVPGGAVFNDHSLMLHTWRVGPGGWSQKTGGQGTVGADASHVYTLSWGAQGEGPVRLLALDLVTGSTTWSIELPEAPVEFDWYNEASVEARDGWIAARVGSRVYVLRAQ